MMWSIGLTKEHIVQSSSFVQDPINEKINIIKVGNITVLNLIEITTILQKETKFSVK